MRYAERPGPEALSSVVECVWVSITDSADAAAELVLPDGCMDIVWRSGVAPFIAGPDRHPQPLAVPAGTRHLGMRFRPGAAPSYLGVPASELIDARVELGELWGDRVALELGERLEHAEGVGSALAVLEHAVLGRAGEVDPPDPFVGHTVDAIRGRVAGRAAPFEVPLSERQLRRRFVAAIGYGPKTLERILRFQRFLALAGRANDSRLGLAELAAHAGYADQAHLTRECRDLAGSTPRQLFVRSAAA